MRTHKTSTNDENAGERIKDDHAGTTSSTKPHTDDDSRDATMRTKARCDEVTSACLVSGDRSEVLSTAPTLYDIRAVATALRLASAANSEPAERHGGGQGRESGMTAAIDTKNVHDAKKDAPRTLQSAYACNRHPSSLLSSACTDDVLREAAPNFARTLSSSLLPAYNDDGKGKMVSIVACNPSNLSSPASNSDVERKGVYQTTRMPSNLSSAVFNSDVDGKGVSKTTRMRANLPSPIFNSDVDGKGVSKTTLMPSLPSSPVFNDDAKRKLVSKTTGTLSNPSSPDCKGDAQRKLPPKTIRMLSNSSPPNCKGDAQRKLSFRNTRESSNLSSSTSNHHVLSDAAFKTTRKLLTPSPSVCDDDVQRNAAFKETAMTFTETPVKTEKGARSCWKQRCAERVGERYNSSNDWRRSFYPQARTSTNANSPFSSEGAWSAEQGTDSIPTICRKSVRSGGNGFLSAVQRSFSRRRGDGRARTQRLAPCADEAKASCASRLKDDPGHSSACTGTDVGEAAETAKVLGSVKREMDVELVLDSIPGSPTHEAGEACSAYENWEILAERWLASNKGAEEQHETQRHSRCKKRISDSLSVSEPIPDFPGRVACSEGWEAAAERWLASDDSAGEKNTKQKRPRIEKSVGDPVSVLELSSGSAECGDSPSEQWDAVAERRVAYEENERRKRRRRKKSRRHHGAIPKSFACFPVISDSSSESWEGAAECCHDSVSDEESAGEAKVGTAHVTWADVWPVAAISKRDIQSDESDQSPTTRRRDDLSSPARENNEEGTVSAAKRMCARRNQSGDQAQVLEMLCTADVSHPCAGFYCREMDGGYYHVDDPRVYMARHARYWAIYQNSNPLLYCAVNKGNVAASSEGPESLIGTWRTWGDAGESTRTGDTAPMSCFDLRDPYFRLLRSLLPCAPIAKCYKQWCETHPRKDVHRFLNTLPQSLWTRLGKHLMCEETIRDMIRVIMERFSLHEYSFFSRAFLESLSKKLAFEDIAVYTCVTDEGFDAMIEALLEMKRHYHLESLTRCSDLTVDVVAQRKHYMQCVLCLPCQFWRDLCASLVGSGNCHREWTFYTEMSPAEATKEQLIAFTAGLFSGSAMMKEKAALGLCGFINSSNKI